MLIGGVGIGFFIWDAWNSSRISDIIVALVYIGIVGFLLDKLIATDRALRLARRLGAVGGPDMDRPYLKFEQIGMSFRRGQMATDVLRDIDLTIAQGEFVSMIGHSGCGKSTLLNILGGLLKSTTGEVFLEGKVVDEPGPDRAIVFQNHSLLPWLTVYGNVAIAVDKVFGVRQARTRPSATTGSCTISSWCRWRRPRTSARTRSPAA